MRLSKPAPMIPALVALIVGTSTAWSQDFPAKPIRIWTSEAGGGNDFAARLIAQGVASGIGQQVIIENRGTAGGTIAAQAVAKSPGDGYTLLFYGSNIWLMPFLRDNVPYDPIRDFAPITLATRAPHLLVVHPSLPVRTARELVVLARNNPGKLNYGSGGAGSSTQIASELLKSMAQINIVHIAYKGSGPAQKALISGEVQIAFATPGAVATHVKSGRLRALAVSSAQPSPLFPDMPTIAATGVPGYETASILGVFAPARTPPALVARLNQEFVRALHRPDVKEKFFSVGIETVGTSSEELGGTVKSEMTRLGKVIKEAGIRDE